MAEFINLQVSNLCLPKADASLGGIGTHVKFLEAVDYYATQEGFDGYDAGYEITPARVLMGSIATRSLLNRDVHAWHYGARTVDGLRARPIWTSSHASFAQFGSKYSGPLETEASSFGSMRYLDDSRRLHLPKVVFGDSRNRKGQLRDYRAEGLSRAITQIHPELLEAWRITLPGQYTSIKDRMDEQGITEIVADPSHVERSHRKIEGNKVNANRLLDVIDAKGIQVRRAHLALARTDFPHKKDVEHSVDNLKALIDSPEKFAKTKAGKFLAQCFDIWLARDEAERKVRCGPTYDAFTVTTEITVDGMNAVSGHSEEFDKLSLPQKHAFIIGRTRGFFAEIEQQGRTT